MSNSITVWGLSGNTSLTASYTQPAGGGVYPGNQTPGPGNNDDNPGSDNGPGGIGVGDGGFNTPSDTTISKPSITFPNSSDNENITEDDTATSSAFAATGSRTHLASRWMIYYVGPISEESPDAQPTVVYDSGPDTVNLTSLPFDALVFEHLAEYKIIVRYKANTSNTWSQWSEYQSFFTADCFGYELILHLDASDSDSLELSGVDVVSWADLSETENHATGVDATSSNLPAYSTDIFPEGAITFPDSGVGFTFGTDIELVDGKLTCFMVVSWPGGGGGFCAMAFFNNDNAIVSGPTDWMGVYGSNTTNGSTALVIDDTSSIGANISAGEHIIEFVIDTLGNESSVWVDGVLQDTADDIDWTGIFWNRICGQIGVWNNLANAEIAEIRIYSDAIPDEDRADIRDELAVKWNITI